VCPENTLYGAQIHSLTATLSRERTLYKGHIFRPMFSADRESTAHTIIIKNKRLKNHIHWEGDRDGKRTNLDSSGVDIPGLDCVVPSTRVQGSRLRRKQ
jgi:hypothetical protein